MDWLHAMPNFTDRRCIAQPVDTWAVRQHKGGVNPILQIGPTGRSCSKRLARDACVTLPASRAGGCRTEPALHRDDVAEDEATLGARGRGRLLMQAARSEERTLCT